VLAPPNHIADLYNSKLAGALSLIDQAKRRGIARSDYLEYAIEHLANSLSSSFEVSIDVLKRRIRADHLHELVP